MSDYDHVQGGSLQLKGVGRVAKTSKNKKKKKALAERAAASAESPAATSASSSTAGGAAQRVDKRTDAERKFDELQKKRVRSTHVSTRLCACEYVYVCVCCGCPRAGYRGL